MSSLLVTNDFPPKVGGIQSYLWELWRRLPPDDVTVLTTAYDGAAAFDAQQPFRIERPGPKVLLPRKSIATKVDALAREVNADVIFVDPVLPLGAIVPKLTAAPVVLITHGAEMTVTGRSWLTRAKTRRVLAAAAAVVAAGEYPAREAARVRPGVPGIVIPPGVDPDRFTPPDPLVRPIVRERFGLDADRFLVLGVSRLVPRKGFDVLIDAVGRLDSTVELAIAGAGRDRRRLERRAHKAGVSDRVHFLGRVTDADLPDLYGCADVFAMCCRERWAGMEAEGFGIVFLEAAACGVPQVAGRSGGSHEAVADGETGFVVEPRDTDAVRSAIAQLRDDHDLRAQMSTASIARAKYFDYDRLVTLLTPLLRGEFDSLSPLPV
jgi:phosphatidylinositol alpha-1,6-mannosyltransferase